jgi:hypothetical protein
VLVTNTDRSGSQWRTALWFDQRSHPEHDLLASAHAKARSTFSESALVKIGFAVQARDEGVYQHRSESIFEIELTDSPIVNYIIKPDNTCGSGSPGTVRLSAKIGHPARSELFNRLHQ